MTMLMNKFLNSVYFAPEMGGGDTGSDSAVPDDPRPITENDSPEPVVPESEDSGDDFGSDNAIIHPDDAEFAEEDDAPAVPTAKTPAPPKVVVPTPPAQTGVVDPPAPTQGQQPATPAPVKETTPSEAQPPRPVDVIEHIKRNREGLIDALATNYNMTEKDVEEYETDPGKVISRVAARVHLDVMQSMMQTIQEFVPPLVHIATEARNRNASYEKKFFDTFPELNIKDHGAAVIQYAKANRAANPGLSAEELINTVGAQLLVALKIPRKGTAPANRQGFRPAGSGGTRTSTPAPAANPWAGMADAFAVEDTN